MLSISFSPLVPDYLLYALAGLAALLIGLAVVSRGPVAILRALAVALVLLALANPALVQEERDTVKDIVAVVIDRSTSQTLGDRPAMTERVRAELQRRLASMPNIEPRFIEGGRRRGRRRHPPLRGARQRPRRRAAGPPRRRPDGHGRRRPRHPRQRRPARFPRAARTLSSPGDRTSATGRSS